MRIEERLEQLEKETRDLRLLLSVLVTGASGTALLAIVAGSIPAMTVLLLSAGTVLVLIQLRRDGVRGIIRAHKLEIVGDDGCKRVELGETVDGAGAVATYDAHGQLVAVLDATGRRPARNTIDSRYHPHRANVVDPSTSSSSRARVRQN